MTQAIIFGALQALFWLIMLVGARETLLQRRAAKAAAARLRERLTGQIPYRSWDVSAASGLSYRVFVLDKDDGLWHQARRLEVDCAHAYCQRRIRVERTRAICKRKGWSELKWKSRREPAKRCDDCAAAFRTDWAALGNQQDLDQG